MEPDQKLRLLYRQLKDIQSQADKITRDDCSMEDLEQFESYSRELKKFILKNYPDREVTKTALEIPDELYEEKVAEAGILLTIFSFSPWLTSYMNERRKVSRGIETVDMIRGKYATLEFLIRSAY
jgi:hypothetical protein